MTSRPSQPPRAALLHALVPAPCAPGLAFALALALVGCGGAAAPGGPAPLEPWASPPSRPAACTPVKDAFELQRALEKATSGTSLCLEAGSYAGAFRIGSGVTVWGPRDAVIRSLGQGTTVRLEGHRPRLLGVTVDGSGGRFDTLDAAVHVQADDAVVEGVRVLNATFGILAEKSNRLTVRNNFVRGDASSPLGLRGDGIRLWETRESLLEGNEVESSRDLVVWYSSGNTVRRNLVRNGRYGTHFMYSHHNRVEDNRYVGNEVGVFIMYSRDLHLLRNVMADGSGAAGMGLGIKESGDITARDNRFLNDTVGLYLDSSPLQQDEHNLFERNVFRLGEAGVIFHSSPSRNTFRGNSLRDNAAQVRVEGGGDALGIVWEGNDFDDYRGFDFDRDGVGDVPYELRSLSSDLLSHYPDLAFFRGSSALSLVSAVGEIVPLLQPLPVLRDLRPRMSPLPLEVPDAD